MQKIENYMGGELVRPASGEYFDNTNPATRETYSQIPGFNDRDRK